MKNTPSIPKSESDLSIREALFSDAQQICAIYNHYIQHSTATFEEQKLTPSIIEERISHITQQYPWLVCIQNGKLVGYAYAAQWKERSAYKNTTEVTVYLHSDAIGKGIGESLYSALLEAIEPNFHVAIAVISLPNDASVKFHEKFGFSKAAHFKEVGMKFNRWIDVGFWQKMLKVNH